MGEKLGSVKPEAEKKAAEETAVWIKKYGGSVVVMKVDMHCEGCGKKIKRYLNHLEGVDDVKIDCGANKVTVIGNVDPTGIREKLAKKIKRKVDLVSSPREKAKTADKQPPKDETLEKKKAESAEKKPPKDEILERKKTENKKDEQGKSPPPKQGMVVPKTKLHREGFVSKINRVISKIKGDKKVKWNVEVVLEKGDGSGGGKNDGTGGGGKKKDKKAAASGGGGGAKKKEKNGQSGGEGGSTEAGGGKKKETKAAKGGGGGAKNKEKSGEGSGEGGMTAAGGGGGGVKVEVNKMEQYPTPPVYWYDGQTHTIGNQRHVDGQDHVTENHPSDVYIHPPYGDAGYMIQAPNAHFHASQMFSDENPNACSLM